MVLPDGPANGAPKGTPLCQGSLWESVSPADSLAHFPALPGIPAITPPASKLKDPSLAAGVSPAGLSPMELDLPTVAAQLEEDVALALALKQKQTKSASFSASRAAAVVTASTQLCCWVCLPLIQSLRLLSAILNWI